MVGASSLTGALTSYGDRFAPARVRLSFAGSDGLAAQIRQGVRPDVFASANAELPNRLFEEGLLERPRTFATNTLVLAVPADSEIDALEDLGGAGTTIALGSPAVPIGSYTRQALARLPDGGAAILANVRSEEPNVNGIVGKLVQGAADAGFVYASDVRATGGRLRTIDLPRGLRPEVAYGVALVEGAENPDGARAFIDGLLEGEGAAALRAAGFGPPPRR